MSSSTTPAAWSGRKGIADLLAAWREFSLPRARLLLIGRPGVKQPVSMAHLPPNVENRPWTDRMDRYLAAADIFVLPSYAEGMSNALLEAMAAGITCISTSVGAAPEMIRKGETGILIEPGDRGALRDALFARRALRRASDDDWNMREGVDRCRLRD